MQLLKIPFPKAALKNFTLVSLFFALSLIFVLLVFQPFGTANFSHPYKNLVLSGYGLVALLGSLIVYLLSELLIPKRILAKWSILHEVFFILILVTSNISFSFLYWSVIVNQSFQLAIFFKFVLVALLCTTFPLIFYLLFLFYRYKSYRFYNKEELSYKNSQNLSISSKSDIIEVNENISVVLKDLVYIKSDDNYVELIYLLASKVEKKLLRLTLKELSLVLPHNFQKCHRSYIVNFEYVQKMEGNLNNSQLFLSDLKMPVPISRSFVPHFRSILSD